MAIAFDTLGFSKALQKAGIAQKHADAHAEAARDFVMAELVTKTDLAAAVETITLKVTIRLGVMMTLAVGALAAILRLT